MTGVINPIKKKINIFNVELVNNRKVTITIYDDDVIMSFLINNEKFYGMSTMNNSDYIDVVEEMHEKLLRNPIKNITNNEYTRYKQNDVLKINFEIIPNTVIIGENSVVSIIKIIDNIKLVITACDDNVFFTKIKNNILNTSSTFYINTSNYDKGFHRSDFKNFIKYYTEGNFSQTEKKVFSQHYSDMQEACNPNYVPVKPNNEPVKIKNDGCILQ